jgi:protease I
MRILFPLPTEDFEPTESAVPWRALTDAGHAVVFATPDGRPARPDERVLTGRGFGPWRPFLRAGRHARALCEEMQASEAFNAPLPYAALDADDFDGLVLTGGHAPGMRTYLDSEIVHGVVARHMSAGKPVGAICHGVLAAARARDPETGRSVLHGRKSTSLTAAQELTAYGLTGLWLGRYYRTYAKTVQREVVEALATPRDFAAGPFNILREGPARPERGFVLRDGNYVSARFYLDTYKFARVFLDVLAEHEAVRDPR